MKHMAHWLVSISFISSGGCLATNTSAADGGADSGSDGAAADSSRLVPGCDVPVPSGRFTIQMIGLQNARGAFQLDVRADGTFAGAMPLSNEHCEGTLTPSESENITATMNASLVFCRSDITACSATERDNTYEDILVRTTDLTRINRFCHVQCFGTPDEPMGAFLSATLTPLTRVHDAGGCTASTYTPPAMTERCPAR